MKIKKNEDQTIKFQIEVEGTDEKIEPRLILKSGDKALMFEGRMEDKQAIFEISKLNSIFESEKTLDASIEVVVEGKFFKPWKSIIEIERPVSVSINEPIIESKKIEHEKIKVQVKEQSDINKPIKVNISGVVQEVFVLESKNNKLKVLTKDGKQKILKKKVQDI